MNIEILVKPVGKPIETRTVDNNDLRGMQAIVGGFIEAHPLPDHGVMVVLNEDGKSKQLAPNFALLARGGRKYDVAVGDVFFVSNDDEGDFVPLSPEQETYVREYIAYALERMPV